MFPAVFLYGFLAGGTHAKEAAMETSDSDQIHDNDKLTEIHLSEYNAGVWKVESSVEFETWFALLEEQCKEAVHERVLLLQAYGPELGRPYADTLKGTKKKRNIKELRCQTDKHVLRVVYYFDSIRNAFLLIGGDKRGLDGRRFYSSLIRAAEEMIEKHEEELQYERCNQDDGKLHV